MNRIQKNEQDRNPEAEPYRNIPEEAMEEAWFKRGERLSIPPDPREVAMRRWEAELSL